MYGGTLFAGMTLFSIVVFTFGIALLFSLPMIWYHVGHISRKLTIANKYLKTLESAVLGKEDVKEPSKISKFKTFATQFNKKEDN